MHFQKNILPFYTCIHKYILQIVLYLKLWKVNPGVVQCWDGARKQGGGGVRHPGYTHVCSLVYSTPGKEWEILVKEIKNFFVK